MVMMRKVIMAKTRKVSRSRFLASLLGAAQLSFAVHGLAQAVAPPSSSSGQTVPLIGGSSSKANAGMQGIAGPVVLPHDFAALRIAAGDLISVSVYDSPELSGAYRVSSEGDLTLPLCGRVPVKGLTVAEARERLQSALVNGQILKNPQVNLDVLQYASQYATVSGEVTAPGHIQLIAPVGLLDVLAQVGGLTTLASGRVIIRHTPDRGRPEEVVQYARGQSNTQLSSLIVEPGDDVFIPRAGIVYVLGAVNKPGGYMMQEDGTLNVAEALALSGGTVMQAKTGGLRVIRRNPDGSAICISLSYDRIAKGYTPITLQPRDIVYVPMSKFKATFSSTSAIIGEASSAAIYSAR